MIASLGEGPYYPYSLEARRLAYAGAAKGGIERTANNHLEPAPGEHPRLSAVDAQVNAHEKAHLAVLGGHAASGIRLDYPRTPDGGRYAVGGSVEVAAAAYQLQMDAMKDMAAASQSPDTEGRRPAMRGAEPGRMVNVFA